MFSGAIQRTVIYDAAELLQDEDSEHTPSGAIQQYPYLCSLPSPAGSEGASTCGGGE